MTGDAISLFKEDIKRHNQDCGALPGTRELITLAPSRYWQPRAASLMALVSKRFALKQFDDADKLVPLYLYPQDCQVKR